MFADTELRGQVLLLEPIFATAFDEIAARLVHVGVQLVVSGSLKYHQQK